MRILHVGKYYYPSHGGIETVLRGITEGLVAADQEARVLCFAEDRHEVRETIAGVEVIRAPIYGKLMSQPVSPRFRRLLVEATRDVDVVHVHSPNPLAEFAAARLPTTTPLVCTYHADVTRQKLMLPAYRPIIRRLLRRCKRILVATEQHVKHSVVLRPHADKCTVIPYGLDPDRFDPSPPMTRRIEALEARYGDFVLFVGRLVSYKGLAHLVDAARELPSQVVIAGDGPLAGALSQQIEAAGLQDRVHMVGRVESDEELLAYYHACRVFVLPSITAAEAFGVVLTEAMACGKPLVTSRLPSGVVHVNQHDVNGLHAEPGDVVGLRAALCRVLEDRDLADRLGRAGRCRFDAEFTTETMIRGHLDVYSNLRPLVRT